MPNLAGEEEAAGAQHALRIAFQTMQERCRQLENRLATVEEENIRLRIEKSKNLRCSQEEGVSEAKDVEVFKDKIEELLKQKSQLTHHIFMVANENRQLWNRLSRLTRTNKSPLEPSTLSSKGLSPNVIDADKQSVEKDESVEEISLRLINSIMQEKVELEQQFSEMVALQNGTDINIRNVGFAYPNEANNDSLQQLKQHEAKLLETKDALLSQQMKLKKVLQNLKKIKKASKKVCQAGTQFDSDDSLREHGATQTSLPVVNLEAEKNGSKLAEDAQICPMCGSFFAKSVSFDIFHEHVLSHFNNGNVTDFELVTPWDGHY